TEFEVQAVYRAVGYFGSPLPQVPFDPVRGVIPNEAGRIIEDGAPMPRTYATGWIKRGPVGLIGSTKSDAAETIRTLLEEFDDGERPAPERDDQAVLAMLEERGVRYTTWHGWERLDTFERELGEAAGRERIKVVPREDMTRISVAETPADVAH
ncbi:MAG TPA: pyridine nucleotide-disulfide oxidoreductase, partial [Beutenbergiaceae bacterium]|nr:pyridine nucleotide-disulfide oxidoreductase [Beutenbergiaceae bacterium]